jgi:hypothetical protein
MEQRVNRQIHFSRSQRFVWFLDFPPGKPYFERRGRREAVMGENRFRPKDSHARPLHIPAAQSEEDE